MGRCVLRRHICGYTVWLCPTKGTSGLNELNAEVILFFKCVVGKCFVVFYVFSFPPAVYVGTLNLIASIPGPSILTLFMVSDIL